MSTTLLKVRAQYPLHCHSIGAVIGVLVYLFVGPGDCPSPAEAVPPFLYGSLFAFIAIQLLAVIVENIIFSISAKGSIFDRRGERKRRWLPFWLAIRVLIYLLEIEIVIVCTVAVFGPAPFAAGALQCPEYHDGPLVFAKTAVGTLIVFLAIYGVSFAIFLDPLRLCHPPTIINKLKDVISKKAHNEEDHGCDGGSEDCEAAARLDNDAVRHGSNCHAANSSSDANSSTDIDRRTTRVLGFGRFRGRVKRAICCLNAGGRRSKDTAFQEVAFALYTLFSQGDIENRLVPSDIVAGMVLLNRCHKRKKNIRCSRDVDKGCTCKECLRIKFKCVSLTCEKHLTSGCLRCLHVYCTCVYIISWFFN